MANRRFIDFPIASTVGDSDIILIWQGGANKQTTKATFLSGLPENLDELNDVTISGLTNGQILRYDSVTGKWENTDQGNLDLNDLNDVSIVSPSNGQVLVYNSSTSKWENSSGGYVPYTGAVTTVNLGAQTIQAGQFVKAGGTSTQFLKADGSVDSNTYGTGTVTSVALTMPSAFNVANSPITTAGTLAVTGAGTVGQYIRGDGSLADFPQASGGGSSVNYYLNGSISQGTIGGVAYKELNKVPILGAGTDFTINADGYIASFLTDAGDPNLLEIPGGNWNFETYFSASSSGGTPTFYVELYKYDGTTFTLIASSSTSPELIAFGTNLNPYFSTLAVPTTTLALTDRLAVRYYVTHSGRTITLHTENNHLCQVVTTFTTGLTSLNGLTAQVQNLAVGTSGTDFNIASATATHTFNLPTASATNRGALSSADWTTFNNKQNALGYVPVPETRTITINGVSQDLSANRTYNVGTVTSVGLSSATSGVTIGGSPVTGVGAFTLAIATASGSQNGLLSSTDWTTFNNKQNALTNPVTGTGASGQVAYFTGTSAISSGSNFAFNSSESNLTIQRATSTLGNALTISKLSDADQAWLAFRQGGGSTGTWRLGYTGSAYDFTINAGSDASIGTQALRIIQTSQNVLIGTSTSDNGARLQVSGGGTFTGNVGVGTIPNSKFEIRGSNSVPQFRISREESTNQGFTIQAGGGVTTFNSYEGLNIVYGGYTFNSTKGTDTQTRMVIDSSGNVGIGTTSPSSNLQVQSTSFCEVRSFSTSTGNYANFIVDTDNSINYRLQMVGFGTTASGTLAGINRAGNGFVVKSGGLLAVGTRDSNALVLSTNETERMRITSGGNVLIGTTSDIGERLTLNGRIGIVGSTVASGNSRSFFVRGAQTVADGATLTLSVTNTSLIFIAENNTGTGALFFCGYASATIVKISDPSNMFDVADTAGKLCIFKSATTDVATVKNRLGSTKNITVTYIGVSD